MVRTKADCGGSSGGGRKAVGASAPRKALGSAGPSTADGSSPAGKGKYAGGNPACPRPTPDWQKGISGFFASPGKSKNKENTEPCETAPGSSTDKPETSKEQDDVEMVEDD